MIIKTNRSSATSEFYKQLHDLTMQVFGFSFDKWHEKGLWTDEYERWSIIENGVMLSNISVYKMKMLMNGLERDCLQLGCVGTRQEHRRKGLSRKIMEHIFSEYSHLPVFLVGNHNAVEYYIKMGFHPVECRQPYISCSLESGSGMVKLDINDPKVNMYLKGRSQFSNILDCTNQYAINWFHLLYGFPEDIYEIPQLDVMLTARQEKNILTIYDIAARKPVSFSQIIPFLSFDGVDTVKFGFNPDWLDVDYRMGAIEDKDFNFLVKGNIDIKEEFILPLLIVT